MKLRVTDAHAKCLCPAAAFATATGLIECLVLRVVRGTTRKCLEVGERKYWHMGDLDTDPGVLPTLINRTSVDVSKYRSNARGLGYEGERLERLAELWVLLLDGARNGARRSP